MRETTNIAKLRAAERRISRAEKAYSDLIAATFKDGQVVHYRHGLKWRSAWVQDRDGPGTCGGSKRVWVEGITGRRYWLYVSSIKEITGG